uniref:Uncharacterized protein n=1 Tax=Arundo donax TaxID=35708 RepID=A0A0A9D7Y9_ARUDO
MGFLVAVVAHRCSFGRRARPSSAVVRTNRREGNMLSAVICATVVLLFFFPCWWLLPVCDLQFHLQATDWWSLAWSLLCYIATLHGGVLRLLSSTCLHCYWCNHLFMVLSLFFQFSLLGHLAIRPAVWKDYFVAVIAAAASIQV